jgi:hypothetical protein
VALSVSRKQGKKEKNPTENRLDWCKSALAGAQFRTMSTEAFGTTVCSVSQKASRRVALGQVLLYVGEQQGDSPDIFFGRNAVSVVQLQLEHHVEETKYLQLLFQPTLRPLPTATYFG